MEAFVAFRGLCNPPLLVHFWFGFFFSPKESQGFENKLNSVLLWDFHGCQLVQQGFVLQSEAMLLELLREAERTAFLPSTFRGGGHWDAK